MTTNEAMLDRVARIIADDLFRDGRGMEATRLVMEFDGRTDGTGWSKGAIWNRVKAHLQKMSGGDGDEDHDT